MTKFGQPFSETRPIAWLFIPLWISALAAFWRPLTALVTLSFEDDRYPHLLLIPFLSGLLIYLDRRRILGERQLAPALGIAMLALVTILYWVAEPWSVWSNRNDQLWLPVLTIVLVWLSTFVFLNGAKSASAAVFPLCFLFLTVPIPAPLLDHAVYGLQKGSAEMCDILFRVVGMPVLRKGFLFSLPGIDIEVAKECSGIRSSLALLITGMLAAHLYLRSPGLKLLFVLLTVPVAILKNAIRIVTLSFLGVYVDRGWLDGPLHHRGGALFALVGLAILLPALYWLRICETGSKPPRHLRPTHSK